MARIQSFTEFWPYYAREHSQVGTRVFHYIGTAAATILLVGLVANGKWFMFPLAFAPGYGCAWFSHFFIEKNKPATFQYPLWSFIADYKMFGMMLLGRMKREVARAKAGRATMPPDFEASRSQS
jgi:hypothetical protein